MISEELHKIKSFGSDRKSAVAEGDISQKEAELGFQLPAALRELYLCFHPDDPAFSEKGKLIPLEELRAYKRICWTDTEVTVLPFCRYERYGYGFEVSRHNKKAGGEDCITSEDPRMWGIYIEPETNKEKKHLNSRDIPCNEAVLSQWIVEWLGYQQTLAQPSVVAVNKDKAPDYWKKVREFFPDNFFDMSMEALAKRKRNFVVNCTEESPGMAYFGGISDKELEGIMKQMGFKYVWIKSQSGHPVYNAAPPQAPRERELLSIALVLQFLCDFAGIEGRGAREESLNRAETRLGNPLPLPLAEFYRCLPGRFYASYNVLRPLSGLKPTKDGRLNFLEENQAVYHWAAELNSPFLYRRANNGGAGWSEYGILDGFLAAEFLWALACDEELGLVLWEFPDFEPEMLQQGGKLKAYLSPIAGITEQIAAGNTRKLYQAMEGQAVGLYDSEERTFWFVTRDEAAQERLEKMLGFSSED